jgi:hypothetical protein
MKMISTHELKAARALRQNLRQEHELLVTNNGRPMALMLEVGPDEDPEAALEAVREARARRALSRVRQAARKVGTYSYDLEQINEIVAEVRESK